MPQTLETFPQRAADEIDALHRLLQAWLRGEGNTDPAAILARFDQNFRMVGAAGNVTTYQQFANALPNIRGSRPTLIMEISDVAVQHIEGNTALVRYRERQYQDTGTTERWSSALLINREGQPNPVHLHLQETFSQTA